MQCTHCKKRVLAKNYNTHLDKCGFFPLLCPLNCGMYYLCACIYGLCFLFFISLGNDKTRKIAICKPKKKEKRKPLVTKKTQKQKKNK